MTIDCMDAKNNKNNDKNCKIDVKSVIIKLKKRT